MPHTFYEVGCELAAVATHTAMHESWRGVTFAARNLAPFLVPEPPRKQHEKILVLTGYGSYPRYYHSMQDQLERRGYEVHFSRAMLKYGFTLPQFPEVVNQVADEVVQLGYVNIIAHSVGGLISLPLYAAVRRKLLRQSGIYRMAILGTPYDTSHVFPFLKKAVMYTCNLSIDPLCDSLTPGVEMIMEGNARVLKNILFITVHHDPLAPAGGGLPGVLGVSHHPWWRLANTHSCFIFHWRTIALIDQFFRLLAPENAIEVQDELQREHPEAHFWRITPEEHPFFHQFCKPPRKNTATKSRAHEKVTYLNGSEPHASNFDEIGLRGSKHRV
jgi:hypothetical protein